jgi:hypothetical protein
MGRTGEILESVLQEIEASLEAGMGKTLERLDQERAGMAGDRRLTGWKEIANFLGVSVSTAQRYHKAGVIPIWQPVSGGIPFTTESSLVSAIKERRSKSTLSEP